MSKYYNHKIYVGDKVFDSKKEYNRYCELLILERAGKICDLQMQYKFELIPRQLNDKGKVAERAVDYIADFYYFDREKNKFIVEDVKGYKGGEAYKVFVLKRKMMRYFKGIEIVEI